MQNRGGFPPVHPLMESMAALHFPYFAALRTSRPAAATFALVLALAACHAPADADAQATAADSALAVQAESLPVALPLIAAPALPAADSGPAHPEKKPHTPARRAWPKGPPPLPGALLPEHRIIAFYGNPLSSRMGVLGVGPAPQMLDHLASVAEQWDEADSTHPVVPALHLIATVAQGKPGPDRLHRLRMSDSLISRVAAWAEERHYLLFLDIQVGQSTVEAELPRLLPFLQRPYVHLALDPEFAMKNGRLPGRYIGTMDASEVNYASAQLAKLVSTYHLPPKILVVHRFTNDMLTNASQIRLDSRVQVVIDMDGFGTPALKRAAWRQVIIRHPVQFTGFKLFFNPRNDKPMMKPKDVLELDPAPLYIQYQ